MDEQMPRQSAHHVVRSLRVTDGFLAGMQLDFVDGLNCLIGGRGAGKTTALEFLRFGLGLMPDQKTNQARYKAIEALVKANLGSGRLNVEVQTRTAMRYTADRTATDDIQVLNEAGAPVPILLDRAQIFGADVYSQNEIEEIASDPTAQLGLLDRFQEPEAAEIGAGLDQLYRQLDQSGVDLFHLDTEVDDLRAAASELTAIEEKLKGLAETAGPNAERINTAHAEKNRRGSEAQIPNAAKTAVEKLVREIAASEASFRASIKAHFATTERESLNQETLKSIDTGLGAFAVALVSAIQSINAAAEVVAASLKAGAEALAERHAAQEAEYRAIISEFEADGGRAQERSVLQLSLIKARTATTDLQAKESRRQDLAIRRRALLNEVSELRDRRFALRKRVAEQLTGQFNSIRVTVSQGTDVQRYRDFLVEGLKGVGLKQSLAADRLIQVFLPSELSVAVGNGDFKTVMQRSGLDEEKARKVIGALRMNGVRYAMELVDLDDRPCIELLDGDKYKESPNLSTGQRCTTILPILLVQSERPLLIDQPEDNLDNAFVYDTIVHALRSVKGSRQVIFVTHNPNIPVLGEAERVFVFSSDGHRATLQQVGTIDECKDKIEQILEGGREAFLQRKTRYGH